MQYPFEPIGVVRSSFVERAEAPRQPDVAGGALASRVDARIELYPGRGFEDALEGLDAWDHAWVLFVFHRNVEQGRGWKPKVQPPRADAKVGVFATRSPHRPNPIGLSVVQIDHVDGLVIHVRGIDALDGTPVLDLKPYVAYADARPDARSGWLRPLDPQPAWEVTFSDTALDQLAWLKDRGLDLRPPIEAALALGPRPHAYRRIRAHAGGMRLALREWRVDFAVHGADGGETASGSARTMLVRRIATGYRGQERETRPGLEIHRDFAARFGG